MPAGFDWSFTSADDNDINSGAWKDHCNACRAAWEAEDNKLASDEAYHTSIHELLCQGASLATQRDDFTNAKTFLISTQGQGFETYLIFSQKKHRVFEHMLAIMCNPMSFDELRAALVDAATELMEDENDPHQPHNSLSVMLEMYKCFVAFRGRWDKWRDKDTCMLAEVHSWLLAASWQELNDGRCPWTACVVDEDEIAAVHRSNWFDYRLDERLWMLSEQVRTPAEHNNH
jgi:hypothetical protein